MQETLYQTADAEVSLSDSGCRCLSIRQRMQEYLNQTADAGDSIRQRIQETLYQTAVQETLYQTTVAGVFLSDSGCRRHSIRQWMQASLHQTADAGDSLSDSGCRRLSI